MGKMNKELTPLQALAYLVGSLKHCKLISTGENKVIKTIKTALKALEIIDKEFDIIGMINKAYAQGLIEISKEEYELLKEVLK